jgi:histidinol-phosphatase (PHP family)
MAMVDAGGFDIIGHLDKIGQNANYFQPGIEEEPWYVELADALVAKVISYNAEHPERPLTVEINTKAYAEHNGRLFPHPRHWQRLRQAGIPLIVNSDAHVPALIDASRSIAFNLLDSL